MNIALINELALLFQKLGIDTSEVLVAGSKWNFLPFRPGLGGGHCIGVLEQPRPGAVLSDVKHLFPAHLVDGWL
ncbi:hypothetical protein ABZN20_05530 [Methylococcus sp. ANG]|uniref:hypothetical protein n=1 Tax=Methylococcus sp. ANG TaxID=3231903 RepID=UPI0034596564